MTGVLRHPSFQGLREDKPAEKVIHDEPLSVSEVNATQNGRQSAAPKHRRKAGPPASARSRRAAEPQTPIPVASMGAYGSATPIKCSIPMRT